MKLNAWSMVGLGVAGVALGCGGSTNGTSDGGADSALVGQPPAPNPMATNTMSTKVETFAVKTLYLGEADRMSGVPSSTAWKAYGYNIDGKVTTKTSTDVCTLVQGAPSDNQVDGNNGIDNAFGAVILPIITQAANLPTPSQTISSDIDMGKFTILIQVTGLDDTPTQTASNLSGQLFAGGNYGSTPAFDMTTNWPVEPQLLKNMSDPTQGSLIQFSNSYVSNGTFVSGNLSMGGTTVSISLVFDGVALTLKVNNAVITFDHTTPTGATNGTIAGVLDTSDLLTGLQSVAGRISKSLCGSAFASIANELSQASDILQNGSNMAGTPCNAISVGLGFDAVLVANPTMVVTSDGGAVPPDPCDSGATVTDANTNGG